MSEAYEDFVNRLFVSPAEVLENLDDLETLDILHAAVGLSGEAGEVLDEVKKVAFTRKPLDREKLYKEIGDVVYYLTALQQILGKSHEDFQEINRAKLEARHAGRATVTEHYMEA